MSHRIIVQESCIEQYVYSKTINMLSSSSASQSGLLRHPVLAHRVFFWFVVGMNIAIVGGGIAGLVSGFLAAEAGHEVEIFERERLGAGASGKALGLLVPITGLDRPVDVLQRQGIAAWPALAVRLADLSGIALGDFWREWGNGRYQLRLPLLFEVLRLAIEAKGGVIHEGFVVDSPALLRDFDRIVLASGWGNVTLGGQDMRVSSGLACRLTGKLDTLVAGDNLFVVPDWDGTVLAGSLNWDLKEPAMGEVPADKLAELRARVGTLVPDLAAAELVDAWVGYRPTQAPRLPLLRDLGDGVIAVAGLGKTGIGLSPLLRVWE